MKHAKLRQN